MWLVLGWAGLGSNRREPSYMYVVRCEPETRTNLGMDKPRAMRGFSGARDGGMGLESGEGMYVCRAVLHLPRGYYYVCMYMYGVIRAVCFHHIIAEQHGQVGREHYRECRHGEEGG